MLPAPRLALHQWLVEPDFDQEGEVQRAEAVLGAQGERPAAAPRGRHNGL